MTSTSYVFLAARMVRLAVLVGVAGLLVGYVAVSSFSSRYGATPMVLDSKSSETALSAAIATQESAGLACSKKPALTDVVLFQRDGKDTIDVLTFDEAIKASSAREGWIRTYCTVPVAPAP
ncbi:hypothetical protein [Aeromicrobium sp. NPDC092404]|uniref:hypothetical protein n=1 Tax=Aeromicrobium sp. NPDC092404 TaxID=3154976 RepID=UPI00344573FE